MTARTHLPYLLLLLIAALAGIGMLLLSGDGEGVGPSPGPPGLPGPTSVPDRSEPDPTTSQGLPGPDQTPVLTRAEEGASGARSEAVYAGAEHVLEGHLIERGTGRPVANGRVLARSGELVREATSGEEGEFEFSWPEGLEGDLAISHPAYVDVRRPSLPETDPAGGDGWVVLLDPAGSIRGRLVGPGATAGAPATVRLWRWVGGRLSEETTAQCEVPLDGGFTFDNLPPGTYALAATKEDAPPVLESGVRVEEGARTDVMVTMPLGARFTALVQMQAGGGPVAGAVVVVEPKLMGRDNPLRLLDPAREVTEGNGRAPFSGLGSGTHRVHVRAPWGDELSADIEISPLRQAIERRFTFPSPASVSGTVLDAAGEPVEGASVRCLQRSGAGVDSRFSLERGGASSEGSTVLAQTETDSSGEFEFYQVPARVPLFIIALSTREGTGGDGSSGGFALSEKIQLKDSELRGGVTLRLSQGFELGGIVSDPDGHPVEGAGVTAVVRWKGQELEPRTGTTAADGSFILRGVPAGSCRVTFEREGFSREQLSQRVTADRHDLEIVMQPSYSLTGLVLDPDGWGVPDARVRAHFLDVSRRIRTATGDDYGRFTIEDLSAGRWVVTAQGPGFPRPDDGWEVEVPQQFPLQMILTPEEETALCTVTGDIVMRGSGLPVKGLRFQGYRCRTVSLDGTRFRLTGTSTPRLRLIASSSNAETVAFPHQALMPGDKLDLGRVETRRLVKVVVRVTNGAGTPIPGAEVVLERIKGEAFNEYLVVPRTIKLRSSTRKGEYQADRVGMYTWRLVARHRQWQSVSQKIQVGGNSPVFPVQMDEPRRRGGDGG